MSDNKQTSNNNNNKNEENLKRSTDYSVSWKIYRLFCGTNSINIVPLLRSALSTKQAAG